MSELFCTGKILVSVFGYNKNAVFECLFFTFCWRHFCQKESVLLSIHAQILIQMWTWMLILEESGMPFGNGCRCWHFGGQPGQGVGLSLPSGPSQQTVHRRLLFTALGSMPCSVLEKVWIQWHHPEPWPVTLSEEMFLQGSTMQEGLCLQNTFQRTVVLIATPVSKSRQLEKLVALNPTSHASLPS